MQEPKLLHLLQKKKSFFQTILELTEIEAELPVKELISVLEQKTVLLACIEEIDEELGRYKSGLYNINQEMQEEIDQTKSIIDTIMKLNYENVQQRKMQFKPYGPSQK